jgi:hypothetical protein
MLFFTMFLCILGCKEQNKIVIKQTVEVFKTRPERIKNPSSEILGYLNPEQEFPIKSAHYDKDFAIYEIDLTGSELGEESG